MNRTAPPAPPTAPILPKSLQPLMDSAPPAPWPARMAQASLARAHVPLACLVLTCFVPAWLDVQHGAGCPRAWASDQEQGERSSAPTRPNVVIILADDLGINDLGCYGRSEHRTPRLDALASSGVRFANAYAAAPLCSPTRAALLTGKAPARLHITTYLPGRPDAASQLLLHPVISQQLALEEVTLAERFKAAGYATACIGKWHLGGAGFGPTEQGFDVVHAGTANTTPGPREGGKGEFDLTAHAVAFIEQHRQQPFFLYLAHNTPHIPLAAREELVARCAHTFNPVYAAMLETLDQTVGLLLDALAACGLEEQTLVVFTSDNGGLHVLESPDSPATHNTPFRAGKGFVYEGGLRVPLIVRWPAAIAGGRVAIEPVISTDLVPTLVELCGLEPPDLCDGASLARLLRHNEPPAPRPLFWHQPHYSNQGGRPAGAVREGAWKLIEHYEDGQIELFNLEQDPGETAELSAVEPDTAQRLRRLLHAWLDDVGAQRNTRNPQFDPALHRLLYVETDVSRLAPPDTAAEMRRRLAPWRQAMNQAVRP